jgi:ABC-type arginine transport system permease subunit
MCFSSLNYPASKAQTLYVVVIRGLSDSTTFSHIFLQMNRFFKKVIVYKMLALIPSTNFSKDFLTLKIIQGDIIINVHRSSLKGPLAFVRF